MSKLEGGTAEVVAFEWRWNLRLLLCSAATVVVIAVGCSSFEHAVAKHGEPRDRLTARDAAEAEKRHAPPASRNAEITGGYWITCKPGFVADSRRGGCVEGVPGNPTYVVEIPNSSGRWGATGSDDDDDAPRRDDFGCCSSHGGIESIAGGSVICRDGRVDSSCSF